MVPDLSYKKKDVEDLLIDTEAHFIENRYHFEPPKPTSTPVIQETHIYTPSAETQQLAAQNYTPPIVTPSPPVNLLSEMDGLMFLGVQPEPSHPKLENPSTTIPAPVQQPNLVSQSNPLMTAPHAPIRTVLPINPTPQAPSYNYSQINMAAPYRQYPVLPPAYSSPYAAGYYNHPIPYNNPMANPYSSYGYQQQPYSPMMPANPYLNQQQLYPPYQSPPQINNY